GLPGYAVQWLEVEGPLYDETTAAGYRLLFDDLPLRQLASGAPGVMIETVPPPPPPDAPRRLGPPSFRLTQVPVEVDSPDPGRDGERLVRRFTARVYRRPVREEEVQGFIALFQQQFGLGHGFARSLLATYTAALAS